jgi:glutamate racemase
MLLEAIPPPMALAAPIGVFDSGLGGLSVLRHIRQRLPDERLIYVADAGHAPYGGRSDAEIADRALAIGALLVAHRIKALVVACNTATAVAITALRQQYPALIVVGVEPGLKPGASASRSGVVGVLATEATLSSQRFAMLRDEVASASGVRFLSQPCSGLVDLIEQGDVDSPALQALFKRYILPLLEQQADTLVLGCTHYPLILPAIEAVAHACGRAVACIDTGEAVARQLARVLGQRGLLRTPAIGDTASDDGAAISGMTSGPEAALVAGFERLLQLRVAVSGLSGPAMRKRWKPQDPGPGNRRVSRGSMLLQTRRRPPYLTCDALISCTRPVA